MKKIILVVMVMAFATLNAYTIQELKYACKKGVEHGLGCHMLGVKYAKGEGVKKDEKKAFYWYMKSARLGNLNAQSSVGMSYYKGEGVKKDEKKAFYWFEKSARQGHPAAQFMMGQYYASGQGAKRDFKNAAKYFKLVIKNPVANEALKKLAKEKLNILKMVIDGQKKADESKAVYESLKNKKE